MDIYEAKTCKYHTPHLDTIREYIGCLYKLKGCSSGGMLHILLDDDNLDDDDILFCLRECVTHPEEEEAQLGKLICEEYLRLSMPQRRLLTWQHIASSYCQRHSGCQISSSYCQCHSGCQNCDIETGEGWE